MRFSGSPGACDDFAGEGSRIAGLSTSVARTGEARSIVQVEADEPLELVDVIDVVSAIFAIAQRHGLLGGPPELPRH